MKRQRAHTICIMTSEAAKSTICLATLKYKFSTRYCWFQQIAQWQFLWISIQVFTIKPNNHQNFQCGLGKHWWKFDLHENIGLWQGDKVNYMSCFTLSKTQFSFLIGGHFKIESTTKIWKVNSYIFVNHFSMPCQYMDTKRPSIFMKLTIKYQMFNVVQNKSWCTLTISLWNS